MQVPNWAGQCCFAGDMRLRSGTPRVTSGADLLSLIADTRGNCDPCDLEGSVVGDYQLVNVGLFWVEGTLGAPDFLATSDVPTLLPEFPGEAGTGLHADIGRGIERDHFLTTCAFNRSARPTPALGCSSCAPPSRESGPGTASPPRWPMRRPATQSRTRRRRARSSPPSDATERHGRDTRPRPAAGVPRRLRGFHA